jgi:membrane protease YdiL (CAAX protease family)
LNFKFRYQDILLIIGIGTLFTLFLYISLKGYVAHNLIQGKPFGEIFLSTVNTAVGEEIIFRSFILGYLKKYKFSPWLSILLQSLLFSLGHLRYIWLGFTFTFLLIFIFGFVAGIFTWKRGSIIPSIILHWEVTVFSLFLGTVL